MDGQVSWFDADTWSGKTCRAHFHQTEGETSMPSSQKSSGSQTQKLPTCLCLVRGGWSKAGCIYGEMGNWSVAWRVHDAKYWGVPQRRKRICVLADLGGLTAPGILFDPQLRRTTEAGEPIPSDRHLGADYGPKIPTQPESLSGNPAESGKTGQGAAAAARSGTAYSIQGNIVDRNAHQNGSGISEDTAHTLNAVDRHAVVYPINTMVAMRGAGETRTCLGTGEANDPQFTLSASQHHAVCVLNDQGGNQMDVSYDMTRTLRAQDHGHPPLVVYENHGQDSRIRELGDVSESVSAKYGTGGNNTPLVLCIGNGQSDIATHITEDLCQTLNAMHDPMAVCIGNGQLNQMSMEPVSNTLDTMHDHQAVLIYAPDAAHALHAKANVQSREDAETYIVANAEVRRLTPLECTRLQGYPDGWLDIGDWTDSAGKTHKDADSPKYKAAGNSIALPFWEWLARRICAQYERPATMGSLFDGIGGFPLAFSRAGATPVWASEIEEYPIAVTKARFPE